MWPKPSNTGNWIGWAFPARNYAQLSQIYPQGCAYLWINLWTLCKTSCTTKNARICILQTGKEKTAGKKSVNVL